MDTERLHSKTRRDVIMRLIKTKTKKPRIEIMFWMLVCLFGFGAAAAVAALIEQIWRAL